MILLWTNHSLAQTQAVGKITTLKGKAFVSRQTGERLDASVGLEIFKDDEIKTGANSFIKIEFNDKTVLTLFEDSEIKISDFVYVPEENQRDAVVDLLKGEVRSAVTQTMSEKSTYKVKTKNAVMGIRGTTTLSKFGKKGFSPLTIHAVEEGLAFVAKAGQDPFTQGIPLSRGMMAIFIGSKDPVIKVFTYDEFERVSKYEEETTGQAPGKTAAEKAPLKYNELGEPLEYDESGEPEEESLFKFEIEEEANEDLYDLIEPREPAEPIEPIEPQCPLYE